MPVRVTVTSTSFLPASLAFYAEVRADTPLRSNLYMDLDILDLVLLASLYLILSLYFIISSLMMPLTFLVCISILLISF